MSLAPRKPARDERPEATAADVPAGRLIARRPRPVPQPIARPHVETDHTITPAEVAALRARLVRYALTLPDVAVGDSGLDDEAAGIFVRVPRHDGPGFEMREFATLHTHPRWRLSVVLPIDAMVDLQRLGWGRPRSSDGPGPLLLELVRPRAEADVAGLMGVVATAHRALANPQARPQGLSR
jgi:hypothetical protein